MFGLFKKKNKPCSKCDIQDPERSTVIVGRENYLCADHLVIEYKRSFFEHRGRKVIIPPSTPKKYTSYQFETLDLLKSYGLTAKDIEPLIILFESMESNGCYEMVSDYKSRDCLDLGALENAKFRPVSLEDGFNCVERSLRAYATSNGVALLPNSNEDVCLYPLES